MIKLNQIKKLRMILFIPAQWYQKSVLTINWDKNIFVMTRNPCLFFIKEICLICCIDMFNCLRNFRYKQ
jgi:hypothetical protein